MLRVLLRTGFAMILIGLLSLGAGPAVQPAAAAPHTWTVLVGGEGDVQQRDHGPAGAWQFMRFYPSTITIDAGDTVTWKVASAEPHTVTFGRPNEEPLPLIVPEGGASQRVIFNPPVILPQGDPSFDGTAAAGSGQMGGGPDFPTEYRLAFTKPGTYDYYCGFHPMMAGKVIVQESGGAYPKDQAQIDADAKAQLAADTQAANKLGLPANASAQAKPGANGASTYTVKIGYGDGIVAWMGFDPQKLTIHEGDTVEWVQQDVDTPHTVTFTGTSKEPEFVLMEPQQAGAPKLVVNPEVLLPKGGDSYAGDGFANSGFIWGTKAPQPGPRSFSLTFTKAGTYHYICVLHDPMGMEGDVIVLPRGAQG